MNESFMIASAWILLLFMWLSSIDGLYFHLWKFRLQEREDSKFEHITHTLRAFLFIPTVILIYGIGMKGLILWGAVLVLTSDLVVEVLDVMNERKSRATLGGLPSAEYLIHIILTSLRVAAFTLAFAALPSEAWNMNSTITLSIPEFASSVALRALPGGIFMTALHVYLIFDPLLVSRSEKTLRSICCPVKEP